MSITIGDTKFDNIDYDREADVLYLHVGDPSTAVDFDESPEGHGLRFDKSGRLVGVTIVSPRWMMEHGEPIMVTVPAPRVVQVTASELERVIDAA